MLTRRWISAAWAVILSITLCACGGKGGGKGLESLGFASAWVDSDLVGSITEDMEIREQDDFAAAVNKEWKLDMGDEYYGVFQGVSDKVMANKKKILTDSSIKGETVECLRDYYRLESNWEERNADGVKPLQPYIEDIQSIASVDELYDFFADPVRNPLFLSPVTVLLPGILHSEAYEDNYAVYFTSPDLTLTLKGKNDFYFSLESEEGFERFEQVRDEAGYLLGQLGYSDKEASDLISQCMVWEKSVAAADNKDSVQDMDIVTFNRKEAIELAGDFPIEKIIDGWGFKDSKYFILNPGYAKKWAGLCKSSNLENIKAFLIVNYCMNSWKYLDRESYDKITDWEMPRGEVKPEKVEPEDRIEDRLMLDEYIGKTPMVGAMNRVYVETFFDDSQTKELTDLTQNVIDTFETVFNREDWLSKEGKKACIEKLKAIKIHVAHQDFDTLDYGKLKIKAHEDGGSFLEAYYASRRFEMDHMNWLSRQTFDAEYWDPLGTELSTTLINAIYMASTNSIYIYAGICDEPIYSSDMSYEEKLGGLFAIVGHEITHGFDREGAQYDKDGFYDPILSSEDLGAFNDRNEKVASYYSTLIPFSGSGPCSGNKVSAEATADMGGITAALCLAEKEKNFDYDLFFRTYARMFKCNTILEDEKDRMTSDMHPLAFYRINVAMQQFDEFYETYDVKKEDKMYLTPKKRIKVW